MFFAIPDDGGVHGAAGFVIGIFHGLLANLQGILGGFQRFQYIFVKFSIHRGLYL
jgi:hypothetical protein